MVNNKPLSDLKNIGKTVEHRLNEIGIHTKTDLKQVGAVKAYQLLSEAYPDKHLPVCYYLYSLEGAIQHKNWDEFSEKEKAQLRRDAHLK